MFFFASFFWKAIIVLDVCFCRGQYKNDLKPDKNY